MDENLQTNDDSLRTLENLMTEFFYECTTNARKSQIEEILNCFALRESSHRHCLTFLCQTQNEYAMMYCLSVLESTVNRKWTTLNDDTSQLRTALWNYLITRHRSVPIYIRNKTGKLLISIAKHEWTHFYPDFMVNVLELLQSRETMSCGLMLLQTTIEELTFDNSRDDLCTTRKEELNKLLLSYMPQVLSSLTNVMEVILDKHVNFLTATPPPSPTQSPNYDDVPFGKGDVLCNAFELSLRKGLLHSIPDMDAESLQISSQTLTCLAQTFASLPLSQHQQINNSLLAATFVFAAFGCNKSQVVSCQKVSSVRLGILAMNCINELVSKCSFSNDATDFIYHIFQNTFHLMKVLIKADPNTHSHLELENLDDDYLNKFTEFLRHFVGIHLRRYENEPSFPLMDFLGLMFQFTFKQITCDAFISALEVWSIYIGHVTIKVKHNSMPLSDTLELYKEPVVSLLNNVIRKIQFKCNQSSLEEMDDESLDDDFKTEWHRYLGTCIELIAKIGEIFPIETFEAINQLFQENIFAYRALDLYIENGSSGNSSRLNMPSESEYSKLHCTLRDLSTALKLIGRVSDYLIGENFGKWFQITKSIIDKLIQSLVFSNKNELFKLETPAATTLPFDFIDVHAQIIATIKAYCHWFSQYYSQDHGANSECASMITAIIENCIEIIICDYSSSNGLYPLNIKHSALHCLYSITRTVRPLFILNLQCVQILYSKIINSFKIDINFTNGVVKNNGETLCLSPEDEKLLCRSISNMLLLPWPLVSDNSQDWTTRTLYHDNFIGALIVPIKNLMKSNHNASGGVLQSNMLTLSGRTLHLLSDVIENHRDSPTRSKQLLHKSVDEAMEIIINLLPLNFSNSPYAENSLHLITVVFDVLRTQISVQFVEKTIQLMLNLFSQSDLNGTIDENISSKLIPNFLEMLTFIVQQTGSIFKSFLPGMILFAFNHIAPKIINSNFPDFKKSLFEFLFQLLLNNWKYFFPNNLFGTFGDNNHGNGQINSTDMLQNGHEFMRIMDMFGQSFQQNDIDVFRQNLVALETLNSRLKLYQKDVFQSQMLKHFLCLFMKTLLSKSLTLLNDDIVTAVYHMASVDFDHFYNIFIPQFLYNCEGLDDNQRNILATKCFKSTEKDLPSFVNNLNRFINDLRYYQMCNNSIP